MQDKPTDRDGARGRGVGDVSQGRQSLAETTGTLWAVVPQDPHPGVPYVSGDQVVIAQQGDVRILCVIHEPPYFDLTGRSNHLIYRAQIEAALGNQDRAMELLRQHGSEPGLQIMHGLALHYGVGSLRNYPPFQEFIKTSG